MGIGLPEHLQKGLPGSDNLNEGWNDYIDLIEKELFEGTVPIKLKNGLWKTEKKEDNEVLVWSNLDIYNRDIFHDAYISVTTHHSLNKSSKPFLADDYITPHINRKNPAMSQFTNPIPLMFLKILPKVTFQFQFDFRDGIITREAKENICIKILKDLGIGAKTNVGYGQFE